jgi:hypothetical protein
LVKIIEEPVWTFSATADGHQYDVSWTKITRPSDGYVFHYVTVTADGEKIRPYEGNAAEFIQAASAYRRAQLRSEYEWKLDVDYGDYYKDCIVDLWQRAEKGEYLGQSHDQLLYMQDAADILDVDLKTVIDLTDELIEEKRIGLTGYIFISYSAYAREKRGLARRTGHKDFTSTEWYWDCRFCGAKGNYGPGEPDSKDIPCIENKYIVKNES